MAMHQAVNPSPSLSIQHALFFDYPCAGDEGSTGVAQPPGSAGTGAYCAHDADNAPYGNVNLNTPAVEQLYGRLGNPARDQGHPFIKELSPEEQEDPAAGLVGLDQIIDLDRGFQVDHTARLSGDLVKLFASKPQLSRVAFYAVEIAPRGQNSASIELYRKTKWLEPLAEKPDVWFWRMHQGQATKELLYTAHALINDPRNVDGTGLTAGVIYRLISRWSFWRYVGEAAAPAEPSNAEVLDENLYQQLGIAGFDENLAFQVTRGTSDI